MTREQAINYLFSSGFTNEQVSDVVRALTYKPRDCANCKHYVVKDTRTNWGSQETTKIYGCERWECEYEPTTKNNLGVDCISRADARHLIAETFRKNLLGMTFNKMFKTLYKGIDNLPSVTPQEPRWIPVSEKLPNDRDWYLGIFKEPDTGWINPLPFICDYVGSETKATTKEHWILRGFTDRGVRDCDYYFNLECVAWMPLPQAYREVEE